MRKNLKNGLKQGISKQTYFAEFSRIGYRSTYGNFTPTICLQNIFDEDGNMIADHMWFNYSSAFRKLGELRYGDKISFVANIDSYHKGRGCEKKQDYKLKPTRNVDLLTEHQYIPVPENKDELLGYVLIKNNMPRNEVVGKFIDKYNAWMQDMYFKITGKKLEGDIRL